MARNGGGQRLWNGVFLRSSGVPALASEQRWEGMSLRRLLAASGIASVLHCCERRRPSVRTVPWCRCVGVVACVRRGRAAESRLESSGRDYGSPLDVSTGLQLRVRGLRLRPHSLVRTRVCDDSGWAEMTLGWGGPRQTIKREMGRVVFGL